MKLDERRGCVRYQVSKNIFLLIRGSDNDDLGQITDLSSSGIGFVYIDKELGSKTILIDLVDGGNNCILRSLLSQIVFSCDVFDTDKDKIKVAKKYGLKFVGISSFKKKILDYIIRIHCISI